MVVPHFMRLQEWSALEEGLFTEEGLEPEVLTDVLFLSEDEQAEGRALCTCV